MSQTSTPPNQNRVSWVLNDENANCSIAQIRDNKVMLFERELLYTIDPIIDYTKGNALFFYKTDRDSLNQDPAAPRAEFETVEIQLNCAFEIYKAFEEIDKENERRIEKIFL